MRIALAQLHIITADPESKQKHNLKYHEHNPHF